jgi:hypothetical protein
MISTTSSRRPKATKLSTIVHSIIVAKLVKSEL